MARLFNTVMVDRIEYNGIEWNGIYFQSMTHAGIHITAFDIKRYTVELERLKYYFNCICIIAATNIDKFGLF